MGVSAAAAHRSLLSLCPPCGARAPGARCTGSYGMRTGGASFGMRRCRICGSRLSPESSGQVRCGILWPTRSSGYTLRPKPWRCAIHSQKYSPLSAAGSGPRLRRGVASRGGFCRDSRVRKPCTGAHFAGVSALISSRGSLRPNGGVAVEAARQRLSPIGAISRTAPRAWTRSRRPCPRRDSYRFAGNARAQHVQQR